MSSLKTGGFGELVREVAEAARAAPSAAAALRTALTLDDRVATEIGLAAVTPADRVVVDLLRASPVGLAGGADSSDRLFLTRTGRVAVRLDGAPAPADAYLLGGLEWDTGAVAARWQAEQRVADKRLAALRDELAREPTEAVHRRIARIEYAVAHMAPVLIYVGERVYSNLGKISNLPGRSVAVGSERSLLTQLRRIPMPELPVEDACFIACLDVLLGSGPPVRAEEFNGAQLEPETLARFLIGRSTEYGGAAPDTVPTGLVELEAAAAACRELRARALAAGTAPYRVINGLNLHKREHLMTAPSRLADLGDVLADSVAGLLDIEADRATPIDDLAPGCAALAARLVTAPAPVGFGSAFEGVLHAYLGAVAEAFDADVAMSRGPQTFDPLRAEPAPDADPLALGTGDFFCCVVPRQAFVRRFGEDRAGLVRTLAAYSARMRFNTWHYLPHTLGIVEREPGRDDWFFAPVMPDVTSWSDQHHTGHVAFGVRYAIRVPFGIDFGGRPLPGLYDLRLLRTSSPPFGPEDLRRAIAAAAVLRRLYQAMSAYEPVVTDFDKGWYGRFHG